MRMTIDQPPYPATPDGWSRRGRWPAYWVVLPDAQIPFVAAYKLDVNLDAPKTVRVHVTADERYELWLNGNRIGRGSERGDRDNWFFETYDLDLPAGRNTLVAKVWSLGVEGDVLVTNGQTAGPFYEQGRAPYAQMSVHPGFLFSPDDPDLADLFATGKAPWMAKPMPGYEFTPPMSAWGTGSRVRVHGEAFAWDYESGGGEGWVPVKTIAPGMDDRANDANAHHMLRPAMLPAMLEVSRQIGKVKLVANLTQDSTAKIPIRAADNLAEESKAWQSLISDGTALTVPPHTRRRILIDLEDYYCAYPEVTTSGGAGSRIRVSWEESLFVDEKASAKGNRDETEGKYFLQIWNCLDGVSDEFFPDGGSRRRFDTLWWECGRYVEVVVETASESLTLEGFTLRETRYPYEAQSTFESSEERMARITPMMVRALQMCSHETYMDCPFYEQLMYVGDTRLEVLTTYATSRDDRLPRKALRMFDASRLNNGVTYSRYPSRVFQIIPPFSLWWVAMVHDFALWRGDLDYVRQLMPGVRAVLDYFRGFADRDGLIHAPNGWNFVDWVATWGSGEPPDGARGLSGVVNLQAILALRLAAELEDWMHEPELATRNRHWADRILHGVRSHFWHEERGIFADNLDKDRFSEHAQCLAILGNKLSDGEVASITRSLLNDQDLERTTIYFSHYLFETFRVLGEPEAIQRRLEDWYGLADNGLKTTIEHPEPTRSDCHAWGAHPMFHFYATFAGIRPTAPGFERVEIRPQLGNLSRLHAKMPTPRGDIEVIVNGDHLDLRIPEGIRGKVTFGGETCRIGD